MRRVLVIWMLVAGVLSAEQTCEDVQNELSSAGLASAGRSLEDHHQGVGRAINSLSFKIVQELRKSNPNGNLIYSPLSISAAFALAYYGANGPTKDELARVFGFQDGAVPALLKRKSEEFGEGSNQIATIANRAYVKKDLSISEMFKNDVGFQNIKSSDFTQAEQSRQEINGWVENLTNGLIKDILPSGSIDYQTRLILINAIYFKGSWISSFPRALTRPAPFHGTSGTVSTEFMIQKNKRFLTKRIPALNSRVLQLPYVGGQFSMFIVLPEGNDGYIELEKRLDFDGVTLFTGLFNSKFSLVQIPKWSFEQTMSNLQGILQSLGVSSAFSEKADFSGITASEELYISDVVHKAKINVDEEGTEAAAATAVQITSKSAVIEPLDTFIADHPFVYFIVDTWDQSIWFQGTFTSP